ncbi:MAG: class I SAM-dependent methyltransferase [Candidatus Nanoarchaeia archaeon]
MEKVTFQSLWKNRPKEKNVMVSDYLKQCLPYMKISSNKRVLDVACGNGLGITVPLSKLGLNVSAFDFTKEGVDACRQNLKDEGLKANIKKADMYRQFPYNRAVFDYVFCFQAIFHGRCEQIMTALSEIKNVLNKNGRFFGTFLSRKELLFDKRRKLYYFWVYDKNKNFKSWLKQDKIQPHLFYFLSKDWEYMVPHYFHSRGELRALLEQYFSEVKIRTIHKRNSKGWFVICKK